MNFGNKMFKQSAESKIYNFLRQMQVTTTSNCFLRKLCKTWESHKKKQASRLAQGSENITVLLQDWRDKKR